MQPKKNIIVNCDCRSGLRSLPEDSIPLVVTSPPYDQIFDYGGHTWNFEVFSEVAAELWRVLAPGGVVCWDIKDQYLPTGYTGTEHRQVIRFSELGFRLHEKLYIARSGITHQKNRHPEQMNTVYILSKGKPRVSQIIADRPNVTAGNRTTLNRREKDGTRKTWVGPLPVRVMGLRTNLWRVKTGRNQTTLDHECFAFPAMMPEALVEGLILTYSKPEELVLDCFSGAGTTAKMALLNHRDYLGFEIWKEAYELSLRRLRKAESQYNQNLLRMLS